MEIVGLSSIHPIPFWLGKIAGTVSLLFLVVRAFGMDWSSVVLPALRPWALALSLLSVTILILSFLRLADSVRMGLPRESTTLITTGIYAYSRNPMYIGVYLLLIASCLYTPNPINLLCALVSIWVHHRIVLAEEKFLADRFGTAWEDYKKRVRRYL